MSPDSNKYQMSHDASQFIRRVENISARRAHQWRAMRVLCRLIIDFINRYIDH